MNHLGRWFCTSKRTTFGMRTALYIFEDNDAAIKQIRKGRSSTVRHMSRTHRVDLDWFFDQQTSVSSSQANLQAASSSSSTWDQTQWKTSNRDSQQFFKPWQAVFFFLIVGTGFGCLEKNLQPNRQGGVNSTPTNTARTELHTAWSHFITRTRVAQSCKAQWLHFVFFVLEIIVIHVSCFTCLCLLPLPCSTDFTDTHNTSGSRWAFALWTITETEAIEPEDLEPRRTELEQIRINYRKDLWEILLLRIWTNLESWCRDVLLPVTDAFRLWLSGEHCRLGSLEVENYEKCWLHHCVCKVEKTMESSPNDNRTGETCWIVTGERSKCKAYSSWSLEKRELDVKFISGTESNGQSADMFSSGNEEPGSHSRVLLKKRWSIKSGKISSTRNKFVYKKNCLWGKGSPRYLDPQRNEESSRTTSWRSLSAKTTKRKSRDNSTAHFPFAANARTDEFYELFWRFSRCGIKLRWEIVLRFQSSCNDSKFSFHAEPRHTRLPLDTWNQSGLQKNVLCNQVSTFDSPETILKEFILAHHKENEDHFHKLQGRGLFSQEMRNKVGTQFQCRHLQKAVDYEFVKTGGISAELHCRTAKTANIGMQFDKFRNPQSLWVWKIRFQNQVIACSDFPSEAMLWIKDVEMVDSMEELKSSRSVSERIFQNFEMLDAKIASALNKIIQNPNSRRRSASRSRKPRKEDRFRRGRQTAFMIYDYFRVTGRSWCSIGLCWRILCYSSWC